MTRKRRREHVVFGARSFRVTRLLYERMTVGRRYRIYSNAAGAVVFDLAPISVARQ